VTVDMNISFNEELITQLSKERNEPEWMLEIRLKAWRLSKELPLPNIKNAKLDNWNLEQFNPFINEEPIVDSTYLPDEMKNWLDIQEESSLLVQRNSSTFYHQLNSELLAKGVIFTGLEQALQEYPELVRDYFLKSLKSSDKVTSLHTALWSGGLLLYIPKGVQVELPIHALFVAEKSGLLPHILIIAEANSSLTYVDHYLAAEDCQTEVHNGVVEIYVGENAQVRYATIHNFGSQFYDYTCRQATVARNGKIEWLIGEMNAGNTLSGNTSYLTGDAAVADTRSIFIGTGKQRVSLESKVCHQGIHTESNITSRGVLLEESSAVFNGVTCIEKGAVKANAAQAEKILMLSELAKGVANPVLLIDEHDVMAGHAASAGPVNPEDVYYLMSRGIPKREAEYLIIQGFLAPVVEKIPLGLREQLQKAIERKLER